VRAAVGPERARVGILSPEASLPLVDWTVPSALAPRSLFDFAWCGYRAAAREAGKMGCLVLDPVYSGKGMAGLIGLARKRRFSADDIVVWIHTGGLPGVFAS
jgi:hypothetical protein